jgi:hypothetical protein
VLSVEHVSRFGMVKALRRRIPVEHIKVFAVVIGVAFHAGCSGGAGQGISGVQAVVTIDLGGYLAVALAAPKRCRAGGYRVALGTVRGAVQALVSPRERAGRYLGVGREREEEKGDSG